MAVTVVVQFYFNDMVVFRGVVLLIIFWLAFVGIANCQVVRGCFVNNGNGDVYYGRNGNGTGPGNTTKANYQGPVASYTSNTAVCPRFTIFDYVSPATNCCINGNCSSNYYLIDILVIECSIDDHIPILILITSFFGFFIIKRSTFYKIIF